MGKSRKMLVGAATLAYVNGVSGQAFAQSDRYTNYHMGWMMGDWGMGWFGMLMMIVFWVLIIAGIISLIRLLAGSRGRPGTETGSRALEVLKERYARGEITRDEFESMKKDILR